MEVEVSGDSPFSIAYLILDSYNNIQLKEGGHMIYRIAICDDSDVDSEFLQVILNNWAKLREVNIHVEYYPSAESFLFQYAEDKAFDILLLDIEMGKMDGVSLARCVRQDNETVQIVFITGFPDFMAEGYEVSALHYLMKPVAREKLFTVLDKAAANLGKQVKLFKVSFDRQTEFVPLNKITYIEAQKQYVIIHTDTQVYRMKASLADTEKELDEYFFKCQRSFIVNLRHILRINNDCVELKNGTEVPISRGMAQKIGKEIIRLF